MGSPLSLTLKEKALPDSYYDESYSDLYDIPVVLDNPTRSQKKDIEILKSMYRGIMLVTGKPGAGKDLFGVAFCLLNKLYFGRPVLLDFKPRRLFGMYIPFDPRLLVVEITKMAKASSLARLVDIEEAMTTAQEDTFDDASKNWLDENETLFLNAILYLSELKRYCYNRNPHNRVNKFIGSVCDVHRHLDLMVLGTHINYKEIDKLSYLKNVSVWAQCAWSTSRLNTTRVSLRRATYITEQGSFDVPRDDIVYWVDGAAPRGFLDGEGFYQAYNTQGMVNLMPVIRQDNGGGSE